MSEWLLSDEKINKAYDEAFDSLFGRDDMDMVDRVDFALQAIAKAQLKKMVDELEAKGWWTHSNAGNEILALSWEDWQALKEKFSE